MSSAVARGGPSDYASPEEELDTDPASSIDVAKDAATLRPYQRECLSAVAEAYQRGVRRQLVCLPTGTGKTVVFSQFPRFFRMKKRMLVLAHREELLEQAADKIRGANPGLRVDVEQASRVGSPASDVVVASVATIGRSGSQRIARLAPDDFFLFVVDEAHHAVATTYRRILEHFGVFEAGTRKLLVGFTATPKRGDGRGLDELFEEIVFSRGMPEMVEAGFLAPVTGWRVETEIDLSSVKMRMGDYVTSQLSQAVNTAPRNKLVIDVHRKLLQGRPTICFCVDVAHAETLAEAFRADDVRAASVTGVMDRSERARVLADFRAGRLAVLTNCMVLTEGYDEPSVAGVLLARPTRSSLLYAQMIGRGTRLHPGKENVSVVDIVDMTKDHPLVTVPTLFGLPPSFNLQGRTTSEAFKALQWTQENRPWVAAEHATSFDDLRYRCKHVDLLDLGTPEPIADFSELAWVKAGENAFRLNLKAGASILVAQTLLGDWETMLQAPEKGPILHRRDRDLRRAIRSAEAYVDVTHPDQAPLVTRRSRWRRMPASDKQLELLRRHGVDVPKGLTKGQASHLIGMLVAS